MSANRGGRVADFLRISLSEGSFDLIRRGLRMLSNTDRLQTNGTAAGWLHHQLDEYTDLAGWPAIPLEPALPVALQRQKDFDASPLYLSRPRKKR